jgi:hypothetical protein
VHLHNLWIISDDLDRVFPIFELAKLIDLSPVDVLGYSAIVHRFLGLIAIGERLNSHLLA